MQTALAVRWILGAAHSPVEISRHAGTELVLEKFSDRNFQTICKRLYGVERRVCLASFYAAHVRPCKSASVRQGFLRHARIPPEGGEPLAELLPERRSHAPEFDLAYTY